MPAGGQQHHVTLRQDDIDNVLALRIIEIHLHPSAFDEEHLLSHEDVAVHLVVHMRLDALTRRAVHVGELLRVVAWREERDPILAKTRADDQRQHNAGMFNALDHG